MLKTISAALLAASMIAAPAFAAGTGKSAQTSTVKHEQAIDGAGFQLWRLSKKTDGEEQSGDRLRAG